MRHLLPGTPPPSGTAGTLRGVADAVPWEESWHLTVCPPCKPQTTLEKCAKCRGLIAERIVRALGKGYHPGCFSCAACGRAIGAESFAVDERDEVYCVADFYRLGSTERGEHPPTLGVGRLIPIAPQGSRHPGLLPSGNTLWFAAPASTPSSPARTRTPTRSSA